MAQGANFDDYYAQVNTPSTQTEGDLKTEGPKLKIKAKKTSDAPKERESTAPADTTPADSAEKVTKKPVTFTPTITFEAAPKIVPRPTPAPRPVAAAPSPVEATPKTEEVKRTGFVFDTNKNFKVRKPQTPRISFEPAPKFAPAPVSAPKVDSPVSGPNKLQAYAKTHQDAPKR